jgi:hypothetical protein
MVGRGIRSLRHGPLCPNFNLVVLLIDRLCLICDIVVVLLKWALDTDPGENRTSVVLRIFGMVMMSFLKPSCRCGVITSI